LIKEQDPMTGFKTLEQAFATGWRMRRVSFTTDIFVEKDKALGADRYTYAKLLKLKSTTNGCSYRSRAPKRFTLLSVILWNTRKSTRTRVNCSFHYKNTSAVQQRSTEQIQEVLP
jgi:hypothetical protein